ncbi:molybdenum cofactor guanylyltransferase [Candidatus Bipolaricaulota sp. J31]
MMSMRGEGARLSGVILAGGEGSRLGMDKAGLVVGGVPVLMRLLGLMSEFCAEVMVAIGSMRPLPFPIEARFVEDVFPGRGPLAGIHAALQAAVGEICLVVACDMPFLSRALLARLSREADPRVAVTFRIAGYIEPFPGLYPRALLPRLEEALATGALGVQDFLRRGPARFLSEEEAIRVDPGLWSFVNVNEIRDLTGLSHPSGKRG